MMSVGKLIKKVEMTAFKVLNHCGFYRNWDDDKYLKKIYKMRTGETLNLDDPKTYNEKIQYLKLHDRKPEYSIMVDKYLAKEYVGEKIGMQHIIPLLGVWDRFEDIDFSKLPDKFVLKCNHDCGGVVICKDKKSFDKRAAKKKLKKHLKQNFYYYGREWPYKNVKPRILCEQYMEDAVDNELKDYKVMCFSGEPKYIQVHSGRYTDKQHQDFYDTDWNKTNISQTGGMKKFQSSDVYAKRPVNLDLMIEFSRELSKEMRQARIDWYEVNGQLYFGEITLFDGSGFVLFDDRKVDEALGSLINIDGLQ